MQIKYVRHLTLYFYVLKCWRWAAQTTSIGMERILKKAAHSDFDPQAFLAKVGDGKTVLTFRKNETVFEQAEAADTVFYVQKGRVKVVVVSEQGKEAVVGIFEPGQFFGEGCLNGDTLRSSTSTALEDSVITVITKNRDACGSSQRAEVLGVLHVVSAVAQKPN
jgi:Cyclic nucleotide-binding domain